MRKEFSDLLSQLLLRVQRTRLQGLRWPSVGLKANGKEHKEAKEGEGGHVGCCTFKSYDQLHERGFLYI